MGQLKVSAMLFTCALMEFNSKINSVQRGLFSMARSVIGQLLLTAPKPPPQLPQPQLPPQLPLPPPLPPPLLQQLPLQNQLPPPPTRSHFQIVIPQSLTLVAR